MFNLIIWVCGYGAAECDPPIIRKYPTIQECGIASRDLAADLETNPLQAVVWYYCEEVADPSSVA